MPLCVLGGDLVEVVAGVGDKFLEVKGESYVYVDFHFDIDSEHFVQELWVHEAEVHPVLVGGGDEDIDLIPADVGNQVDGVELLLVLRLFFLQHLDQICVNLFNQFWYLLRLLPVFGLDDHLQEGFCWIFDKLTFLFVFLFDLEFEAIRVLGGVGADQQFYITCQGFIVLDIRSRLHVFLDVVECLIHLVLIFPHVVLGLILLGLVVLHELLLAEVGLVVLVGIVHESDGLK